MVAHSTPSTHHHTHHGRSGFIALPIAVLLILLLMTVAMLAAPGGSRLGVSDPSSQFRPGTGHLSTTWTAPRTPAPTAAGSQALDTAPPPPDPGPDPMPHAAVDWQRLTPAQSPETRCGHAMAYDEARQQVILFGGGKLDWADQGPLLDDTWAWDGVNWQALRISGPRPSPRAGHAMTYDAKGERILLYGGRDNTGRMLDDFWSFDGRQWAEIRLPRSPGRRDQAAMTNDRNRERVVFFGGRESPTRASAELLELLERSWDPRRPSLSPLPRFGHAMAFDEHRQVTVMFGGTRGGFPAFNDTWEWNGAQWTQTGETNPPPAVVNHALVFDHVHRRLLAFGGRLVDREQQGFGGTWSWNGHTWARLNPRTSPPGRTQAAMTVDRQRNQVVLFGGLTNTAHLNDTWIIQLPDRPLPGPRR